MANIMMLTKTERERLENRDSIDAATRARNEMVVRTKLLNWLRNAPEALEILHLLPKKQLDRVLDDEFVYSMLFIAERLMIELKFGAIYGAINSPEDWHVTVKETDNKGNVVNKHTHKVRDVDIKRDILLRWHAGYIHSFHPPSPLDPVWETYMLLQRTPDERVEYGKYLLRSDSNFDVDKLYESLKIVSNAVKSWHAPIK